MLCEYGCGQEAKYKLGVKKWCCEKSSNSCPERKRKNSEGLLKSYENGTEPRGFAVDKELQKKSNVSRINNLKDKPFEEWGRTLKDELILQEQDNKCLFCKTTKDWFGKELTFELDHIDGNNKNNKRENLRLLCPNCHSTTDTWRGRNNNGLKKVSDDELKEALIETGNIRQALLKVGLVAKGANYKRIKKYKPSWCNFGSHA